ncbi:hypothetical protein [Streptomyces sp. NBC_00696]
MHYPPRVAISRLAGFLKGVSARPPAAGTSNIPAEANSAGSG